MSTCRAANTTRCSARRCEGWRNNARTVALGSFSVTRCCGSPVHVPRRLAKSAVRAAPALRRNANIGGSACSASAEPSRLHTRQPALLSPTTLTPSSRLAPTSSRSRGCSRLWARLARCTHLPPEPQLRAPARSVAGDRAGAQLRLSLEMASFQTPTLCQKPDFDAVRQKKSEAHPPNCPAKLANSALEFLPGSGSAEFLPGSGSAGSAGSGSAGSGSADPRKARPTHQVQTRADPPANFALGP